MAAATRSKQKQDTRKPNLQPNRLAETISLVISFAGKAMATLAIPQNGKLSDKGNITFRGGIRKGWKLEGDPMTALGNVALSANGTALGVSSAGVHKSQSAAGNLTVFHSAVVEIANSEGEPERYMVQVYVTNRVKHGDYNLSVSAFPFNAIGGVAGPAVVGELVAGDGFVLDIDDEG